MSFKREGASALSPRQLKPGPAETYRRAFGRLPVLEIYYSPKPWVVHLEMIIPDLFYRYYLN